MGTKITGGPGDTGTNGGSALSAKLPLDKLVSERNICNLLDDEQIGAIASQVSAALFADLSTREDWEAQAAKIMDLAMQVSKPKSYPWPGASNVKFPLLTVAALQYHARAYQTLAPGSDLVKYEVFGPDAKSEKMELGKLLVSHMNWQIAEQCPEWESGFDRLLLIKSILGCVFRKIGFDPVRRKIEPEVVFPKDLVINYYAKSLDAAFSVTHMMERSENYIQERMRAGLYREVDLAAAGQVGPTGPLSAQKDAAQRMHPAGGGPNPYIVCEQCTWLDLDGDGYREPYVVVFERNSNQVLRIFARFKKSGITYIEGTKRVLCIDPVQIYIKWGMIPSPDGGVYDVGLGSLLYPINSAIDTGINQLIDAGTLANTAGGFLGRGVRMKAGQNFFQPFGWKPVDSSGDDLRKNVFPLPVREPNAVLLNLIQLLIGYAERVANSPDVIVGELPGQNTPAETSRNAGMNAERVLSAMLRRDYRSLKDEFKVIYELNSSFLDLMQDNPFGVTREHYTAYPSSIRPAAEPTMLGETQSKAQAGALRQLAQSAPGYNLYEVEKRVLSAWRVPNIEQVLPDPKGPNAIPAPPNPKLIEAQVKQQLAGVKQKDIEAKARKLLSDAMVNVEKAEAQIELLRAQAEKARADAQGVGTGHAIAMMDLQLGEARAAKEHHLNTSAELRSILDMLMEPIGNGQSGQSEQGRVGGMADNAGNTGGDGAPAPAG